MNTEKKKVKATPLNKFTNLENLSFHLAFVLKIAMAYIGCGKLLRDDASLSQIDDASESFRFGDFSKIIALARKLTRIYTIENSRRNSTLTNSQSLFIRNEGVNERNCLLFIKKITEFGITGMDDFDKLLDPDQLRKDLIIFLWKNKALYTLIPKNKWLDENPPGIYDSFLEGPWLFLGDQSSTKKSAEIIVGLALVFEEAKEKAVVSNKPPHEHLGITSKWSPNDRVKNPGKFLLTTAAEVQLQELVDLGIGKKERWGTYYNVNNNVFDVTYHWNIGGRTVMRSQETVTDIDAAKAAEEMARMVALYIQNNGLRSNYERRGGLVVQIAAEPTKLIQDSARFEWIQRLHRAWTRFFKFKGTGIRRENQFMQELQPIFMQRLGERTSLPTQDFVLLLPDMQDFKEIAIEHLIAGTSPSEEDFNERDLFDGEALREFFEKHKKFLADNPDRRGFDTACSSVLIHTDGSVTKPYYSGMRRYCYQITFEGDLLIEFHQEPTVHFRPKNLTVEQLQKVAEIEAERGLAPNALGLNENLQLQLNSALQEVKEKLEECPCCKGTAEAHSLDNVFAQQNFGKDIFTTNGAVICTNTGQILSHTNRQATQGNGWSKSLGKTRLGNLFLRGFNKEGKLVLSLTLKNS